MYLGYDENGKWKNITKKDVSGNSASSWIFAFIILSPFYLIKWLCTDKKKKKKESKYIHLSTRGLKIKF